MADRESEKLQLGVRLSNSVRILLIHGGGFQALKGGLAKTGCASQWHHQVVPVQAVDDEVITIIMIIITTIILIIIITYLTYGKCLRYHRFDCI